MRNSHSRKYRHPAPPEGGSDVGDRKIGHDPFFCRRPDVVQAMKHRQHYRRVAKTPEAMDENFFGAGFMDQA
jgi:hypothetical protein